MRKRLSVETGLDSCLYAQLSALHRTGASEQQRQGAGLETAALFGSFSSVFR